MNERPSVAPRFVFIGLAVSLVLSLSFGLFVYYRYIRYVPVAESLLPPKAELAVLVNVEQGVVYQPFRDNFFPLLEVGRDAREPRLMHLERKTTLELGVDTRELGFAFTPGGGWVVVLGGLIRKDGVEDGVLAMLKEEGRPTLQKVRPDLARVGPGAYLSTAHPGTLRLASGPDLFQVPAKAPTSREPYAVLVRVFPQGARQTSGGASELTLIVRLEADFPFDFQYRGGRLDAAELETGLKQICQQERPALLSALGKAQWSQDGSKLEGHLAREGFDELLAELAGHLRQRAALSFDP